MFGGRGSGCTTAGTDTLTILPFMPLLLSVIKNEQLGAMDSYNGELFKKRISKSLAINDLKFYNR
jgi:hypothetical protein